MNQILERLKPWAPTMLLVGLVAALFESVEESDRTSIFILLVALAGAALILPAKRPLNREEVRVEIMTGVRAMVQPSALQGPPPVKPDKVIRSSGSTRLTPTTPPPGSVAEDSTIDLAGEEGKKRYDTGDSDDDEWRRFKEGHR